MPCTAAFCACELVGLVLHIQFASELTISEASLAIVRV